MKLLNPGPVNVTKGVRRALLRPDICHREEEFSRLLAGIRERLARVTDSRRTHAAALLTGSGTLAVEAMLATYATRTLVLANGVYGDRLGRILAAHRVPFCKLEGPDGAFPALSSVEEALEADPRLEDIALVHHETSTGVLNPLEAVARLAKKHGKKLFVDAVSSIGSERIALKDIDFLAGSAGKCLHGYPGVSFVLVKKRWAAEGRRRGVYLDAAAALESQEDGSVAFTPAVQLFYAFDAALKELEHEGLGTRIRRYASKSAFVRAGLKKMDLRLLAEDPAASHALTAVRLPPGLSYERLHDALKKRGFVIYAGQSALKDSIFRIAHMGAVGRHDLKRLLRLIGRVLRDNRRRMPTAIVLAAGVGRRLARHTTALPKCLVPLSRSGETLLSRYFDSFRACGIRRVVLVTGHHERLIRRAVREYGRGLRVRIIHNRDYRKGSVLSLYRASAALNGEALIMDADVYFPTEALVRLLAAGGSAFLMDPRSKGTGEEMMLMARGTRIAAISKKTDKRLKPVGEATGLAKFSKADARTLRSILKDFYRKKRNGVEYEEAYGELLKRTPVTAVPVGGLFWTEMDFESDLKKIRAHLTIPK